MSANIPALVPVDRKTQEDQFNQALKIVSAVWYGQTGSFVLLLAFLASAALQSARTGSADPFLWLVLVLAAAAFVLFIKLSLTKPLADAPPAPAARSAQDVAAQALTNGEATVNLTWAVDINGKAYQTGETTLVHAVSVVVGCYQYLVHTFGNKSAGGECLGFDALPASTKGAVGTVVGLLLAGLLCAAAVMIYLRRVWHLSWVFHWSAAGQDAPPSGVVPNVPLAGDVEPGASEPITTSSALPAAYRVRYV